MRENMIIQCDQVIRAALSAAKYIDEQVKEVQHNARQLQQDHSMRISHKGEQSSVASAGSFNATES